MRPTLGQSISAAETLPYCGAAKHETKAPPWRGQGQGGSAPVKRGGRLSWCGGLLTYQRVDRGHLVARQLEDAARVQRPEMECLVGRAPR